jgi:selenide,water dikinase
MSPGVLDSVLRGLPRPNDPNLLVGFETSDDAGIYRLNEEQALVQTVDFFTPIVDDPYTYGQVAAANALSDVFAMGGRPITALTIVAFPAAGPTEILEQVMLGGLSKMVEAKCTVLGGHSIRDDEMKFGYAVTGLVHPKRFWRNVGARPGDVLLLTKAIGTGMIATALKQGSAAEESIAASTASMTQLNGAAAEALRAVESAVKGKGTPIHAVTDVTGFGLLGHAREMAIGSGVSFRLDHTCVSYLPGALEASQQHFLSGGLKNNREFLEGCVGFSERVKEEYRNLFYDPQTSGGFLVALAPEAVRPAQEEFSNYDIPFQPVGAVFEKRSPLIEVF